MKKGYIYGKLLLVGLFILSFNQSCTDLDEEVFSELTEANFPTTNEQFISALGATYTSLYNTGSHNSYYSLNAIAGDELHIPQRGNDWFDGGQWLRVHRHTYNANEESVRNGWATLYGGINNCNRVIDLFEGLVTEGKVDATTANGFIAEVKALRAYFYWVLLDMYGNVPIVTSFAGGEANPATKSRQEVYNFVESELATNVPLLTAAKDGSTYARFNQWAGKALQVRLYLNAEVYTGTAQWQQAADIANEIINSGLYSLEGDYFANFNEDNTGSTENIFVVPYDQAQAEGFNWPAMTLHYSSQATFDLTFQPWNGYCAVQDFYESYDDTDLRKGTWGDQKTRGNFIAGPQFEVDGTTPITDTGAEANDPDGPNIVFTPDLNELEPGALRQAGTRIGKYEFAIGTTQHLNNDFVLFRFAEVLLSRAEAMWRMNSGSAEALSLVNQIRNRAGLADLGALTADDLLAETGREMAFEGIRRPNLIRFGKYNDDWSLKGGTSDPNKNIFPIPAEQLSANPNLVQNPGY